MRGPDIKFCLGEKNLGFFAALHTRLFFFVFLRVGDKGDVANAIETYL